MAVTAETAYLFRHALLRDAAYELQLPKARARLHLLAADILEAMPEAGTLLAREIADHLRLAAVDKADRATRAREERFAALAAGHADASFKLLEAVVLWQRVAELSPDRKADALRHAGRAALQYGLPVAESLLKSALKCADTERDERAKAHACGSMANLYQQIGRLDDALAYHERAIKISRDLGSREFEGVQVGNIANLYFRQGRLAEAEAAHESALAIHREQGNRKNEAVTLGNLAGVLQKLGRMEEAERLFEQSISLLKQSGELRSYAIAMANFGNFLADGMRLEQSRRVLTEALRLVRESGNHRFEGNVQGSLGLLYCMLGQPHEGMPRLALACAIHQEVQNWGSLVHHGLRLALWQLATGDNAAARMQWKKSALHAQEHGQLALVADLRPAMLQDCERAGVPPLDPA